MNHRNSIDKRRLKMSSSSLSPETSLSSSSSKDDEDIWEADLTPAPISRLNSLDCWDYTIELECLRGPEG